MSKTAASAAAMLRKLATFRQGTLACRRPTFGAAIDDGSSESASLDNLSDAKRATAAV
jgi:hypothetical protein